MVVWMPSDKIKIVRKDIIAVEDVKVSQDAYNQAGKKYYRNIIRIPKTIEPGRYDLILIPHKDGRGLNVTK